MMRLVTDYCPMQRLWLCVAQGLVARAAWFARDCIDKWFHFWIVRGGRRRLLNERTNDVIEVA